MLGVNFCQYLIGLLISLVEIPPFDRLINGYLKNSDLSSYDYTLKSEKKYYWGKIKRIGTQ